MESITSLLGNFKYPVSPKQSRRTWRTDFEEEFVAQINSEREKEKSYLNSQGKKILLKPMNVKSVHFMTRHLKTGQDMAFLLSECKDVRNRGGSFSKTFFGSMKIAESSKGRT